MENDSDYLFDRFGPENINENDEYAENAFDIGNWTQGDRHPQRPKIFAFEAPHAGLQCELPENPTFLDFVKLFLTDHHFDIMVQETNRPKVCTK